MKNIKLCILLSLISSKDLVAGNNPPMNTPIIFVENKIGNDSFPIELQNLNTDQLVTLLKSKFDVMG